MSTNFSSRVSLSVNASFDNLTAFPSNDAISQVISLIMSKGTGANQCTLFYTEQRALATTESVNLNMYAPGTGVDAFGNPRALSSVKFLLIQNLAPVAGDVATIGGAATGPKWTSPFSNSTAGLVIRGGGLALLSAPDASGYAVAAGSSQLLSLVTSGNSAPITLNIFLFGN